MKWSRRQFLFKGENVGNKPLTFNQVGVLPGQSSRGQCEPNKMTSKHLMDDKTDGLTSLKAYIISKEAFYGISKPQKYMKLKFFNTI